MRSPTNFIVRPKEGRRYDNIKKIGGIDFITSTSKEDHKSSNRFAEVVSTPISYDGDIKPGDTIVVHHNVFKYYYDMKGREKSGRSFLKDDLFLIDPYQYYLYNDGNGWKCDDRFCFVKPILLNVLVIVLVSISCANKLAVVVSSYNLIFFVP